VTLVEARSRRHHFQRHAVRSLGLTNVETLLGRVEDLEARRHDVVVAQAVGPPEKVVELALPWARAGGRIHVPGLAAPPESPRGISAARTLAYRLPLSEREIPVWVGIRAGD
jgi:16S rRNA G527 N7-methylase RsmG